MKQVEVARAILKERNQLLPDLYNKTNEGIRRLSGRKSGFQLNDLLPG